MVRGSTNCPCEFPGMSVRRQAQGVEHDEQRAQPYPAGGPGRQPAGHRERHARRVVERRPGQVLLHHASCACASGRRARAPASRLPMTMKSACAAPRARCRARRRTRRRHARQHGAVVRQIADHRHAAPFALPAGQRGELAAWASRHLDVPMPSAAATAARTGRRIAGQQADVDALPAQRLTGARGVRTQFLVEREDRTASAWRHRAAARRRRAASAVGDGHADPAGRPAASSARPVAPSMPWRRTRPDVGPAHPRAEAPRRAPPTSGGARCCERAPHGAGRGRHRPRPSRRVDEAQLVQRQRAGLVEAHVAVRASVSNASSRCNEHAAPRHAAGRAEGGRRGSASAQGQVTISTETATHTARDGSITLQTATAAIAASAGPPTERRPADRRRDFDAGRSTSARMHQVDDLLVARAPRRGRGAAHRRWRG